MKMTLWGRIDGLFRAMIGLAALAAKGVQDWIRGGR